MGWGFTVLCIVILLPTVCILSAQLLVCVKKQMHTVSGMLKSKRTFYVRSATIYMYYFPVTLHICRNFSAAQD
jgi:hypothetical protein